MANLFDCLADCIPGQIISKLYHVSHASTKFVLPIYIRDRLKSSMSPAKGNSWLFADGPPAPSKRKRTVRWNSKITDMVYWNIWIIFIEWSLVNSYWMIFIKTPNWKRVKHLTFTLNHFSNQRRQACQKSMNGPLDPPAPFVMNFLLLATLNFWDGPLQPLGTYHELRELGV